LVAMLGEGLYGGVGKEKRGVALKCPSSNHGEEKKKGFIGGVELMMALPSL